MSVCVKQWPKPPRDEGRWRLPAEPRAQSEGSDRAKGAVRRLPPECAVSPQPHPHACAVVGIVVARGGYPPTLASFFAALSPSLASVSDDPNDDTLSYAIAFGNDAGNFAISNTTGVLSVVAPLDYLVTQSFTLLVMVSKARLPSFQTGCTVFITGARLQKEDSCGI